MKLKTLPEIRSPKSEVRSLQRRSAGARTVLVRSNPARGAIGIIPQAPLGIETLRPGTARAPLAGRHRMNRAFSDFGLCRLACCLALFALATIALTAAESSGEKARQALRTLQSDAPPQDKALACKTLAVFGAADAVPALAPLLTNEQLSSWARIALEVIPGPAADEALRNAMDQVKGRLLVGVINSIGVRGDAKAVSTLAGRLGDADAGVASAAAVALGRIGGDPAARALEQSLPNAPAGSRSAVAQGCILCAEHFLAEGRSADAAKLFDTVRQAAVPKQRVLEATRGAILARKADGLPLLLETLRSPDKATCQIGLRTARELPGREVTEALAAELEKTAPNRQDAMLLALADRSDPAALPAVYSAAKSGSKNLRLVAIGVLEKLGDPACVPVLLDTVVESDADLVAAAKIALLRLPDTAVNDPLMARLRQVTGAPQRALVELAGQRHLTVAVPELTKAAGDADAAIRAAGIKALGETVSAADLGALTDLLAGAKSADELAGVEAALQSACLRLSDKAACADKLLAGFAASATPAKCALLRVLGTVSTASALGAVQSALASPEATVRDTALRVLAEWSEPAALPALFEVFRTTSDETHRFLALRGCVRLLGLGGQPLQQTVAHYGELLASAKSADDRKAVLSGLAGVPDPAALKLVEPLLADPQVQAEAELALLGIAGGILGSAPADAKAAATRLQTESKNERTRDRAAQLLQQAEKVQDFITAWEVAGPYTEPDTGSSIFDTAFPPEKADGKAAWRILAAGTQADRPWLLDLLAALGGEHRAGYARTWIYSEKAQAARIEFGTDDGHKLWVNGKLVHAANRAGAAMPGDFKANVQLRQGWNALLLKVTQDIGPWEFCLRVRAPSGGRLDGLRAQAAPPES